MAGTTFRALRAEALLLRRVCLVNENSAGFERCDQGREEFALQKEKNNNQIVLLPAEVLLRIQISELSGDQRGCPGLVRILLGPSDADSPKYQSASRASRVAPARWRGVPRRRRRPERFPEMRRSKTRRRPRPEMDQARATCASHQCTSGPTMLFRREPCINLPRRHRDTEKSKRVCRRLRWWTQIRLIARILFISVHLRNQRSFLLSVFSVPPCLRGRFYACSRDILEL